MAGQMITASKILFLVLPRVTQTDNKGDWQCFSLQCIFESFEVIFVITKFVTRRVSNHHRELH